jgi:hypothetical protein
MSTNQNSGTLWRGKGDVNIQPNDPDSLMPNPEEEKATARATSTTDFDGWALRKKARHCTAAVEEPLGVACLPGIIQNWGGPM